MSFFSRSQRSRTANPPEVAPLTDNLVARVWHSIRRNGEFTLHWGICRRHPHDSGRLFRSLRPEHLLEFPQFLTQLSQALARVESLPKELREELEHFSRQMAAVEEVRRANGAAADSERFASGSILGK